MVKTACDLNEEDMKTYRQAALNRAVRLDQAGEKRLVQAWSLARQAADLLRKSYGVQRVAVFGSLVHEGCFTPWSDVDLAVWGLHPHDTFKAMNTVQQLATDIVINLVDIATCSVFLRHVIESEGVEIE